MSLSIIDIEPINAGPIDLDPLDRNNAYIIKSLHSRVPTLLSYLFKTNFQQLQCNNESNIDWE